VGGRGEREEEHGGDEDTSMAVPQLPITKKNSNLLFISTIQPHLNYPTASSISSGYEVSKKNRKQNVKLHRLYADADADADAVRLCLVH